MVALENGDVYAWGYNGNGQLGLGNNINQLNACKIPTLQGIVIIKVEYSVLEIIFHLLNNIHLNHEMKCCQSILFRLCADMPIQWPYRTKGTYMHGVLTHMVN